jgi:carbon-monoxide dehydrogenase small subunit
MKIRLRVNGKSESVEADPGAALADILRSLGHVEVKKACGSGSCGLCTVLMDGMPVPSCSVLAGKADGHAITTIRGLGKEAAELATFIAAEGAEQCGYCSPGLALMVLDARGDQALPGGQPLPLFGLRGAAPRRSEIFGGSPWVGSSIR